MSSADDASSNTTTDHDVIRSWAEARGGVAASATASTGEDAGVLRIEFRDDSGELEEMDGESFFRTFDDRELAFLYQEHTSDGRLAGSTSSSAETIDTRGRAHPPARRVG